MTVEATSNRWEYAGNGVTPNFPYTNQIFDATTDLKVYVENNLVTSGYSVTGVGAKDGGEVVFVVQPDANPDDPDLLNVVIVSTIPTVQPTTWTQITDLPSKLLERVADREIRIVQQLD